MTRNRSRSRLVCSRARTGIQHQKDRILFPNPKIHPLVKIGFLLSNKLVRDDMGGRHWADGVVLGN